MALNIPATDSRVDELKDKLVSMICGMLVTEMEQKDLKAKALDAGLRVEAGEHMAFALMAHASSTTLDTVMEIVEQVFG